MPENVDCESSGKHEAQEQPVHSDSFGAAVVKIKVSRIAASDTLIGRVWSHGLRPPTDNVTGNQAGQSDDASMLTACWETQEQRSRGSNETRSRTDAAASLKKCFLKHTESHYRHVSLR